MLSDTVDRCNYIYICEVPLKAIHKVPKTLLRVADSGEEAFEYGIGNKFSLSYVLLFYFYLPIKIIFSCKIFSVLKLHGWKMMTKAKWGWGNKI